VAWLCYGVVLFLRHSPRTPSANGIVMSEGHAPLTTTSLTLPSAPLPPLHQKDGYYNPPNDSSLEGHSNNGFVTIAIAQPVHVVAPSTH
jgi:hypothetical protein